MTLGALFFIILLIIALVWGLISSMLENAQTEKISVLRSFLTYTIPQLFFVALMFVLLWLSDLRIF